MKKHAYLWPPYRLFSISLRKILIIAFILQLVITLSLVGFLSFRYGQQAVLSATDHLRKEITARVVQNLHSHLNIPVSLNQVHANTIESGLLNPFELKEWRGFLWRQIQYYDSISFTILGNEKGDFISVGAGDEKGNAITGVNVSRLNGEYDLYRYRTDQNGHLTDLVSINKYFDPRTRPWYKAAIEARNPTWSEIFQRTDDPNLLLSATKPIYNKNKILQGVLTTSFRLSALSEFLETLDMPEGGIVYVIEDTYNLVANSIKEPIYRISNDGITSLRRETQQSHHPLIQASGYHLQNYIKENGLLTQFWNSTFSLEKQEHLLQVTPFQLDQKINWLIVVVLPKKAFMSPIYESTRDTIMLSLLAVLIAIISAWFMARWISRPLRQLQQRVHWLMALDWEKSAAPIQLKTPAFFNSKMDEVDDLARSFNQMAKKLQHSFDTIQHDLIALQEAQIQLRKLSRVVEQSPIAIIITDLNGKIEYVNPCFIQKTGYSLIEVLGQTPRFLKSGKHDNILYQQLWESILNGETWQNELLNRRRDGFNYWEQVTISPIRDSRGNITHYLSIQEDLTERKRTEQALRESEERFNLAMKGSNEGLWDWDLNSNLVYFSPRWKEMLGYSIDELGLGIHEWKKRVHPKDLENLINDMQLYWQKKNTNFSNIHRMQHKAGHYIWVLVRGIAVWDEQDKPRRFVGTHMDLTSQKNAETALRSSEARFKAVYHNAACGIMLFNFSGQVQQMNRLGCDLFGYQNEELSKVNLFESMPSIDRGYHQQKLSKLLNNEADSYRLEQRFNKKSGELFWLEIWVAKILISDVNEPTFMAILLDINDRKRMLQALNENRQRLQSIINHLPIILYHLDANGIFTLIEGRGLMILDMNPSDIIGRSVFAIYKDNSVILNALEKSLKGEFVRYELALNDVVFEAQQFPVHNEIGQITSVIGVAIDITQRRQAEHVLQRAHAQAEQARQEAEQANHAKSAFLANMSHELRTPLNSILGYAQLLIQASQLSEHQRESIRTIMRSGEHLLTLINDVLDISKIEAGKLELFPSDFYLPEFLKEIIDLFRLRATQKGLTFGYEQIPAINEFNNNKGFPIIVHADEKRLRQILLNLLSNAVKFTEKGHVSLKIIHRDNYLRFEIEDTGCGIPVDQLEKIFLPFQQIGSQHHTEGTGLGLSITRRLVEAMGGELHINSLLGVGSVFWFEVQLAALTYTIKTPAITELLTIKGYHSLMATSQPQIIYRILIVDDVLENRLLLINLLKPLGFELKEATNGFEALLIARYWRPDAILMDLKLPKVDGLNITRRLRKYARFQDTAIIALTADLFEYNRENSLEAGCNLFLTKPVDHQQLLNSLQQILQLEWDYYPHCNIEQETEAKKIISHPLEQQQEIDNILKTFAILPHIEQLIYFCRAGRISQISEYAKNLQNQYPQLHPFTEVILTYSRAFNIAKIQLFLQNCQDNLTENKQE